MTDEILGKISSEESMGLVDGPGIRYVVFMQGCQLRCKYCHNPETWRANGGQFVTPEQLITKIERFRPYFGNKGGVTFSGGEPLLQPLFLLECLKLCKQKGINTALDTSGVGIGSAETTEEVLNLCDLVILDVKATKEEDYKNLTAQSMTRFNDFLSLTQRCGSKLWLRQVIVPDLNDDEENIDELANFIRSLKNVERVELLPFKNACENKYKTLGIKFAFEGKQNMDEKRCGELEGLLREKLKK